MGAIGRYEVESLIGKGAMGVVFLARDPNLGRQVAIKTIEFPEGISEETARQFEERLLREAHAAAALSHPNIVTVHDVGVDPVRRFPYIVMEFVPGRSLKDLLDGRHRLEPALALRFGDALAGALAAAHDAGIVHRDIKPANILVRNTDGIVKITDFGVARLAASELTRTGALIGSPAYMSPEQVRGGEVDARSDLFSLAVVLYEALTTRRPFGGEDLPAVLYAVAHETPAPITGLVGGLPPGLDPFFARALAKDPAHRFADGAAFRRALNEAAGGATADRGVPATATRAAAAAQGRATATRPEATAEAAAAGPRPATAGGAEDTQPGDAPPPGAGLPPAALPGRRAGLLAHPVLIAILLFFVMTVAGVPILFAHRRARLDVDGRGDPVAGRLAVRLDGAPLFERALEPPPRDGAAAPGTADHQAFAASFRIPPGRHEVEAVLAPAGGGGDLRDAVVLDLSPGESRTLRLVVEGVCGRPGAIRID